MTVKFISRDEPENRVRLGSLCSGAAFWYDGVIHIKCDEVDRAERGDPFICLRPVSGYLARIRGDELVLPTTLEVREV